MIGEGKSLMFPYLLLPFLKSLSFFFFFLNVAMPVLGLSRKNMALSVAHTAFDWLQSSNNEQKISLGSDTEAPKANRIITSSSPSQSSKTKRKLGLPHLT